MSEVTGTPTLQTERLVLRPLALSDAPAIQRHFNNWNIIQHLAQVVPDLAELKVGEQSGRLNAGGCPGC